MYLCLCMHTWLHAYVCMPKHVCVCVCVCLHACVRACVSVHAKLTSVHYFLQYLEWQGLATTLENIIVMSATYKNSGLYQPECSSIGISSVTMVRKL